MKVDRTLVKILGSEAKVAVLGEIVPSAGRYTANDLAERCSVSLAQVGRVLRELCEAGLILSYDSTTPTTYELFRKHPLLAGLLHLFGAAAAAERKASAYETLREHGLAVYPKYQTTARLPLEDALALGVDLAQHDATLLSLLPAFMAKHRDLYVKKLRAAASQRRSLPRRVGMLWDYTGTLVNDAAMQRAARRLFNEDEWPHANPDHRRLVPFSGYFRKGRENTVKENTASVAKEWGFYLSNSDQDFRARLQNG